MLERLAVLIYAAGLLFTLCLIVCGPFVVYAVAWARHRWQRGVAAILCYLILVVCLGCLTYVVVPADYTLLGRWTLHPRASGLNEIHETALDDASRAAPDAAEAIRERIRAERRDFAASWLRATVIGVAMLLPIVLWWWRRPTLRLRGVE